MGAATNPETLILGIAHGLDARTLEPFVHSLTQSGYDGRVRILLGRGDDTTRAFLESRGVEVEVFPAIHERLRSAAAAVRLPRVAIRALEYASLRVLAPLAGSSATPRSMSLYTRVAPLDATAIRYPLYRACLAGPAGHGVRRALLVDTRDVIFQGDPFAGAPADGIAGFHEESSWPIGRCDVNATWLRACYGPRVLKALADRPIFCSGTVLGERGALLRYLDAMTREIARVAGRRFVSPRGFDQACHNFLLHGTLPAPLTAYPNGHGAVMHLGHRATTDITFDPHGRVLGDDGRVVPIVHQWDRHAAIFGPVLDRLRA